VTGSLVTHLECSATGTLYPAKQIHGLSEAGKPLLVRYDLESARQRLTRDDLAQRPPDMWRLRELLPVQDLAHIVSLGEPATPLIRLHDQPATTVLVKDESRLPTGSFKARGLAVAVSMALELGLTKLAMPTNGNAGAALAAYGARAGIETFIFCPADTPETNVREIALHGGRVWRVDGLIDDCGKIVAAGTAPMGWFDVSTLKEPYRIEGKKTMGFELAEQLGWEMPDVIFYPTGGGTGLIGMWKAFHELREIGWIEGPLPRMVAVQSTGCAPIVRAFDAGATHAERWENASTIASGIRVPAAVGDFLILSALRDSGGFAIAVDDESILDSQQAVARDQGLLLSPEGAATHAAMTASVESSLMDPQERAVLFNCGSGLKYPMPAMDKTLSSGSIDWDSLV
jgi:threonine synthase